MCPTYYEILIVTTYPFVAGILDENQAPARTFDKGNRLRRTAQPARRPEGQAASEIFCGHITQFACARALSFA
jgi:hypothetical protein